MASNSAGFSRRVLFSDLPARVAYGVAAVLGLLFVLRLYPLAFLAGHGAFFVQGDAAQHVTGWLFYAQDSWHFPLLMTQRLNAPDGVSIAFTDSIPLAALFFKAIARWLPSGFHYFGLWQGFAFVLQAVAAAFLIRVLGVRHLLGLLGAVVLAVTWPALLWRLGHTSLMSQGLILFALGFYFLGRDQVWNGWRTWIAFTALCLVGLLIHPYFLAFIFALYAACLGDRAIAFEGWLAQLPRVAATLALLAVTGALLGYYGNAPASVGYGMYSLNLDAPFCGSRFFSCVNEAAPHQFSAFHFADATGGQYEGFNYFGAGLLLLLIDVLITQWRAILALPRRFPALLFVLLVATLFALSNKIYFGAHLLLSYPLPHFLEGISGTFRSSGRFFWMVGYLILFATLAAVVKRPSGRAVFLLALALPLQWIDVRPLRVNANQLAGAPAVDDLSIWTTAMTGVDQIHLFPSNTCAPRDALMYSLFQRVAAAQGKLLDGGFFARAATDCTGNALRFAPAFLPRQLYVMTMETLKNPYEVPAGFKQALRHDDCVNWRDTLLCLPGQPAGYWTAAGLSGIQPVSADVLKSEWPAAALPTQIGTLVDGRLQPKDAKTAGYLSFGPYINLPPRRYRFVIEYASASAPEREVGTWDIAANGGSVVMAKGAVSGSNRAVQRIEGEFDVAAGSAGIEIRTFFSGGGADFQLIKISLD
jgi:hypothetical protein